MSLPIVDDTYDYFDDGKINPSRRLSVKIIDVIPFCDIDEDSLLQWNLEVNQCSWLYSNDTDYFVKGILSLNDCSQEIITFVRTIDGGWFSLGYWAGRLDLDGKLLKEMKENYKN